jgi:hypothetical protein
MDNSLKDDYILVILSCKKYKDVRRTEQISQFLTDNSVMKGMRWFHVEGNKKLFKNSRNKNKQYIINEDENLIITNTKDDYLSLAHKTIVAFKAIVDKYKFKYILKTDDDQRLLVRNFFPQLDQQIKNKNPDYLGRIFNMEKKLETYQPAVHKEDGFPEGYIVGDGKPFTNGRFYGLSHRNVSYLVSNKFNQVRKELSEDWAIAKYQHLDHRNNIFTFENMHIFMDYEPYEKIKELQKT